MSERISLQEAAERLGVHYMTAYRYVRTGKLPAERDGVKWTVAVADLASVGRSPTRDAEGKGRVRAEGPGKLASRLVAGDEAGAWAIVEAALASGVDPAGVHLDLLVPAMRSVGEGWAAGRWTVADEHRASGVAARLVGRLGPMFARRGRKRGTVVLGAPAGEQHGLTTAIVADLLRGEGFAVLDMGSDSPAASFVDTARSASRLVAVLIGVTTPGRDTAVRAAVRALRQGGVEVPILLGGAAISDEEHALALGADAWSGPDGRTVTAAVERAVTATDR